MTPPEVLVPAGLAAAVAAVLTLPAPGVLRLTTVLSDGPNRLRRPDLLAAAAGTALALVLGGWGAALLAAAALPLVWAGRAQQVRRRERSAEQRSVVEACSALAAELRAGRPLADALQGAAALAAGGLRAALLTASSTARLGGDVPAALLRSADRSATSEVLRSLAACWRVCSGTGAGLAEAVTRLAEGARARQRQERAVQTALAGPRASALVLALLPVAGLGLAVALGARPLHVLLHTPLGRLCLLGGVVLEIAGIWWTRRIVARASR